MSEETEKDYTDGRAVGSWESRYDAEPTKHIKSEGRYLLIVFVVCIVLLCLAHSGSFTHLVKNHIDASVMKEFNIQLTSFVCGTFGGTLFSLKWLYHSVANGMWNRDRRLWRYLTPLLSGGLAWIIFVVISSGLFGFVNILEFQKVKLVMAVSFIAGYFSDSAVAKLTEIAQSVFGKISDRK